VSRRQPTGGAPGRRDARCVRLGCYVAGVDGTSVAIVSVAVVGGTSVIATIAASLNGGADRRHARQLAQDARIFDFRRDSYVDIVGHLELLGRWIQVTEPIGTYPGMPSPPTLPTDEAEGQQRLANLTVFASRRVYDAVLVCTKTFATFRMHLNTKRAIRAQVGGTNPESHPQVMEVAMQMQTLRDLYPAQLAAVEDLMREEMSGPTTPRLRGRA
jgi:hypothetical protein